MKINLKLNSLNKLAQQKSVGKKSGQLLSRDRLTQKQIGEGG